MPLPSPSFDLANKNAELQVLMRPYMLKALTGENFDFYFSKEGPEALYNKYIKDGGEAQINIASVTKLALDEIAKVGQWERMRKHLQSARDEIAGLVKDDVLKRFEGTADYRRWAVAKFKQSSDAGAKAITLLTKELKSSKDLATLKALMLVVEGGRSLNDRKEAYSAIKPLVKSSLKVPVIFKTAGLAVPK